MESIFGPGILIASILNIQLLMKIGPVQMLSPMFSFTVNFPLVSCLMPSARQKRMGLKSCFVSILM